MTLGSDVHRPRNGVELTIFGRSRLRYVLIAAAGAGAAGHPDSDDSFAAFETTVLPPTGKYLPGDMCSTEAVRAIVLVVSRTNQSCSRHSGRDPGAGPSGRCLRTCQCARRAQTIVLRLFLPSV